MVNGSHPVCAEGWLEQDVSYSTRALWLLLVAPLTIWKFVAPPRPSFAVVEFHLNIMFVAPTFRFGFFFRCFCWETLKNLCHTFQHRFFMIASQRNLHPMTINQDIGVSAYWRSEERRVGKECRSR